jgi:hypothetical protein
VDFPKDIYIYGDKAFRGRCPLEKHETQAFFALLRNAYPSIGLIATHQRNEGKLAGGWRQANLYKKEGMVSGASDIIIPGIPSFVCEMKRKDHTKSDLSERQIDYLMACKAQGSFVCVALGADAALQAVQRWMQYSQKIRAQLKALSTHKNEGALTL